MDELVVPVRADQPAMGLVVGDDPGTATAAGRRCSRLL
jgi:hypothetical protein